MPIQVKHVGKKRYRKKNLASQRSVERRVDEPGALPSAPPTVSEMLEDGYHAAQHALERVSSALDLGDIGGAEDALSLAHEKMERYGEAGGRGRRVDELKRRYREVSRRLKKERLARIQIQTDDALRRAAREEAEGDYLTASGTLAVFLEQLKRTKGLLSADIHPFRQTVLRGMARIKQACMAEAIVLRRRGEEGKACPE